MNIRTLIAVSIACFAMTDGALATTYSWPENPNDNIITEYPDGIAVTQSPEEETLLDVARRFNLGQAEVVRLNPDIDRWHVKKMRLCLCRTDEFCRIRRIMALP